MAETGSNPVNINRFEAILKTTLFYIYKTKVDLILITKHNLTC